MSGDGAPRLLTREQAVNRLFELYCRMDRLAFDREEHSEDADWLRSLAAQVKRGMAMKGQLMGVERVIDDLRSEAFADQGQARLAIYTEVAALLRPYTEG